MSTISIDSNDKYLVINGRKTFPVFLHNMCIAGTKYPECDPSKLKDFTYSASRYQPINLFESAKLFWTYDALSAGKSTFPEGSQNKTYFLGYYQVDEPNGTSAGQTVADLEKAYNDVKAFDSNHPVILNHWTNLHIWYPYCDIITWDFYTFRSAFPSGNPVGWSRADSVYAYEIGCKVEAFKSLELNSIPKPVWAVVQAVGKTGVDYIYAMYPKEVRCNTYSALCMDVRGIGFWTNHYIKPADSLDYGLAVDANLQTYYKQISRELRSLNDILVSPTQAYSWYGHNDTTQKVTFSTNPTKTVWYNTVKRFSYILKKYNNNYYLIVVNKDKSSISNVQITIAGITGNTYATTLGLETQGSAASGRTITGTNGKFTDTFDEYAVHIYKISTCAPPKCTFTVS